ncbi:Centromere protein P, partial [Acanthisitta chloris]
MEKNICQVYEAEIQALEEEIKVLTEKYEEIQQEYTSFSDEEILKSIKLFQREILGENKGYKSPSNLIFQLENLETDLLFLMKFTGFQFTSHSKKTLERTGNRTVQKNRLSGKCHSLSFQLEFQLTKMQENVSSVITDLKIMMESEEGSDVSKFVSRAEECRSLLKFFRSISSYAEWHEHRRNTFLHFK